MTAPVREVLVLGGGSFVGGALAREALGRGWRVTCLSRGLHPLPDGVRAIRADRRDPHATAAALAGLRPELVVDTWDQGPTAVVTTARALAGTGCRYGYVSTRSVYAAWPDGADETAAVVPADPDAASNAYGADKRGGELAAERELGPSRVASFRAGAILGPGENHGRLPWWTTRLRRGGPVLAPGPPGLPLQYVDVRDLAAFAWDALDAGLAGPVDVTCPSGHTTMAGLLTTVRGAAGSDAELVWADPGWLLDHGVRPWSELPLWAPPGHPYGGLHTGDTRRARSAGLRCRPLEETVTDTVRSIDAGRTPPDPVVPGLGMDPAVEARLLEAWGARTG